MLQVHSIFLSINGECCKAGQGSWTVFLRFSGCAAMCSYCDSKYALTGGKDMTPVQVAKEIKEVGKDCKRVTITGGEPLEQTWQDLYTLIWDLEKQGYEITIETNGCHPEETLKLINDFPNQCFVVDYKLPSAGKVYRSMDDSFFLLLYRRTNSCFVKFVIKDSGDFQVAIKKVQQFGRDRTKLMTYFSPCGIENASWLFQKMKKSRICKTEDVRFNLQIHKVVFPGDWREEEE